MELPREEVRNNRARLGIHIDFRSALESLSIVSRQLLFALARALPFKMFFDLFQGLAFGLW